MDAQAPIGVFDSGWGGLSVLAAIRRALPNESLLFLADHAYLPYGERSAAAIGRRATQLGGELAAKGCKAVVVACNTATAAAAEELRGALACPVVAMEPAVKPAAAATRSGVIGVLGTGGTLVSSRFAALLGRYAEGKHVVTRPAPELVDLVERGDAGTERGRAAVEAALQPLLAAGADVIVLGCTHFPMLRADIEAAAGPGVTVIDTGAAVARELERRLRACDALAPARTTADARFWTTGEPAAVRATLERLWPGAELSSWPPAPRRSTA